MLIGDLFTDKVDVVWEPMESLYSDGKTAPGSWTGGIPGEQADSKSNEWYYTEAAKS